MNPEIIVKFLFFIWGLFIGSFLNVCIYRMPREESVVFPRSHCVHCGKLIRWFENCPLLSYIFLKGKCSSCKKPISPRYFLVELLTGSLFVLFYSVFGLSPALFIYLALICGLIIATFVDFDHRIIPDAISLGGLVVGLGVSLLYPDMLSNPIRAISMGGIISRKAAFINSLAGAALGGLTIYLTGISGNILFKEKLKKIGESDSMGFGDVKFLAMIGAFLGWQKVLLVFFLAPLFGTISGIILKLKCKTDTIPYGPYLSLAALIVILWGEKILDTIFYL